MKLKSQNENRRLRKSSLFILSIILGLMICSLNTFKMPLKADTVSYDGSGYSIIEAYEENIHVSGTLTTGVNVFEFITTITINFDKIYSGRMLLNIGSCTYPRTALKGVIGGNVYLYSIGTNNISFYVDFNGVNRIVITLSNVVTYTGNINTQYNNWAKTYPKITSHSFTDKTEMTASEVQTLLNMKNAIYDIRTYVDGLETVLLSIDTSNSQISNHLQTVHNDLVDLSNKLTTTNTKLTSINSTLSSIDTTLTGVDTKLTNIDTKLLNANSSLSNINSKMTTANGKLESIIINGTDTNTSLSVLHSDNGTINNNLGVLHDDNIDIIDALENLQITYSDTAQHDTEVNIENFNDVMLDIEDIEFNFITEFNNNNANITTNLLNAPTSYSEEKARLETITTTIINGTQFRHILYLILLGIVVIAILG